MEAMNRRSFLAALAAAPLIARPTLEDIERLTWRRKFFPGWASGELAVGDVFTIAGVYQINPMYRFQFHRDAFVFVVPAV